MLCRRNACVDVAGSVPVFLNVYDITPINGYTYWAGLGVYHSGVQVHGVEYAYGAHEYPTTGIFEGEPKKCEGFIFRKGILIGWTELGPNEVRRIMEDLAKVYKGNNYNLITKNCNHFCNDACVRLTGNPIPSWVNRLARIGFFCNCVIPASITTMKIGHQRKQEQKKIIDKDKKNAINSSKRLTNSSNSSSSSSSSPLERPSSRRRRPITPTSPLIQGSPTSSSNS